MNRRLLRLALPLAVLAPCYWLPQIMSLDLASHAYTAWLAGLIKSGQAPGLFLAAQSTNVLFDILLEAAMARTGVVAGQRIAVSVCVLVFFSGACYLMRRVCGRAPWPLALVVAMLSYGFVFHMGFLNFYLSAGLAFFLIGLLWRPDRRGMLLGAPLLAAIYAAHPIPAAWCAGQLTYAWLARRIRPRDRFWLLMAVMLGILFARLGIQQTTRYGLRYSQMVLWHGADQLLVFTGRDWIAVWGLLAWWVLLAFGLVKRYGRMRVFSSAIFHLVLITAAIAAFIPTRIFLPPYNSAIEFISERTTLLVGILVCVLLARARIRPVPAAAALLLAGIHFGGIYIEQSRLAVIEEAIRKQVLALPRGSRVISGVCLTEYRRNYAYHALDRACIGHCYSYGNYEPTSLQFRIRAQPHNGIVVTSLLAPREIETGNYTVKPEDLPLYRVEGSPPEAAGIRALSAGERLNSPCQY
jgi:hypothetical protein